MFLKSNSSVMSNAVFNVSCAAKDPANEARLTQTAMLDPNR
jgi:hypothetical protein